MTFDDEVASFLGQTPSGDSGTSYSPSGTGVAALRADFKRRFGRDLTVTGTMANNPYHKSPEQADVRTRDLSAEHRRWVKLVAPTYGLRVKDFSSLTGPTKTATGVRLSGPHFHLEPVSMKGGRQTATTSAFDREVSSFLTGQPATSAKPSSFDTEVQEFLAPTQPKMAVSQPQPRIAKPAIREDLTAVPPTAPPDTDVEVARKNVTKQYPTIGRHLQEMVISRAPAVDDRQLEFYPADEERNPTPGKPHIQVFNQSLKGKPLEDAIAGDALHQLGQTDPAIAKLRTDIAKTITPEQRKADEEAYKAEGDQRPFDQWFNESRLDAYIRGGLFPDAQDEWRSFLTPQQHRLLDKARVYLSGQQTTPAIAKPTAPTPVATGPAPEDLEERDGRVYNKKTGEEVAIPEGKVTSQVGQVTPVSESVSQDRLRTASPDVQRTPEQQAQQASLTASGFAGVRIPAAEIRSLQAQGLPEEQILKTVYDEAARQIGLSQGETEQLTQLFGVHPFANIMQPGTGEKASVESILAPAKTEDAIIEFQVRPEILNQVRAALRTIHPAEAEAERTGEYREAPTIPIPLPAGAVNLPIPESVRGTAYDIAAGLGESMAQGAGQTLTGAGILGEQVGRFIAPQVGAAIEPVTTGLQQAGERVGRIGESALALEPGQEPSFLRQGAGAIGSGLTYLPAGIVLGPAGGAALGALQSTGSTYEEAIKAGLSPEDAKKVALYGIPLGLTELWGIGGIGGRLAQETAVKGFIRSILKHFYREATEEGLQEATQQVLQNLIAKGQYDPQRGVFQNVGMSALLGAIAGGTLAGGTHAGARIAEQLGGTNAQDVGQPNVATESQRGIGFDANAPAGQQGAGVSETPRVDEQAVRTAPDVQERQDVTGPAIWRSPEGVDFPITVTGVAGVGPDGRQYVTVEGSNTALPLEDIQYATETGEIEQSRQPEYQGAARGAAVPADVAEIRQGESRQPDGRNRIEEGGQVPPERTVSGDTEQDILEAVRGGATPSTQTEAERQAAAQAETEASAQPQRQVRRLQHEQFGEVAVSDNQGGVPDGKLRVTDGSGTDHIIQNPRTAGNRAAAFIRPAETAGTRQFDVEQNGEIVWTGEATDAQDALVKSGVQGSAAVRPAETARERATREHLAERRPEQVAELARQVRAPQTPEEQAQRIAAARQRFETTRETSQRPPGLQESTGAIPAEQRQGGPFALPTAETTAKPVTEGVEEIKERQRVARANYDEQLRMGLIDIEQHGKLSKGLGMRTAAEIRQATGELTGKEAKKKAEREASNYIGKPVEVNGQPATVVSNPFGRVKVEFESGGTAVVDADAVTALEPQPISSAADVSPKPGDYAETVDVAGRPKEVVVIREVGRNETRESVKREFAQTGITFHVDPIPSELPAGERRYVVFWPGQQHLYIEKVTRLRPEGPSEKTREYIKEFNEAAERRRRPDLKVGPADVLPPALQQIVAGTKQKTAETNRPPGQPITDAKTFRQAWEKAANLKPEEASQLETIGEAMARGYVKMNPGSSEADFYDRFSSIEQGTEAPKGPLGQPGKGTTQFLADGRAVIKAFQSADISTALHETAHVARRYLDADSLKQISEWAGITEVDWGKRDAIALKLASVRSALSSDPNNETLKAREVALSDELAPLTRAEERFARAFEKYFYDGKAPTPAMQGVFDRIMEFMRSIYLAVRGSDIDIQISPEVEQVFARVLGEEIQTVTPSTEVTGSFKTAKGSTYQVHPDGTTTRDKAARPEHPGEQGPQPRSQRTVYITPESAEQLGEIQTQGTKKAIVDIGNNSIGVQYLEGKDSGRVERRTVVPYETEPKVGLTPLELWKDGRKQHFGNPITEVRAGAPGQVETKVARETPGQVETKLSPSERRAAILERMKAKQAPAVASEVIPTPTARPRPSLTGDETLTSAVIKLGRLKSLGYTGTGEVKALGAREGGRIGLFSKTGLPVEEMIDNLNNAGYGPFENAEQLTAALDAETRGQTSYSSARTTDEQVDTEWDDWGRNNKPYADDHAIMTQAFDNPVAPENGRWIKAVNRVNDVEREVTPKVAREFTAASRDIGLSDRTIDALLNRSAISEETYTEEPSDVSLYFQEEGNNEDRIAEARRLYEQSDPQIRDSADPVKSEQLSLFAFADAQQAIANLSSARGEVARRGVPAGAGVRTLGLAVTPELVAKGRIDLRGRHAPTTAAVAEIAQIYRDPRYETLRIIYLKGDQIVAHEGLTSRLAGAGAGFFGTDMGRSLEEMRSRMSRLGADGYYLLHNHPSGRPEPSGPDKDLTFAYAMRVPGFKGHVVINSGTYGFITVSPRVAQEAGRLYDEFRRAGMSVDNARNRVIGSRKQEVVTAQHKLPDSKDELLQASIPHDALNRPMTSPLAVTMVGQRMESPEGWVSLIYRASSGNVRAVQEMPRALFLRKEGADFIRGQQRKFGGTDVIGYYGFADEEVQQRGEALYRAGVLLDHAQVGLDSALARGVRRFPIRERIPPGQRVEESLSTEEYDRVVEKLKALKKQGMSVDDYLAQQGLFGRELSPQQEELLKELATGKGRRGRAEMTPQSLFETAPTVESRREALKTEPQRRIVSGPDTLFQENLDRSESKTPEFRTDKAKEIPDFFRVQDSRTSLPTQSRNYWSGTEDELMPGTSAFVDLYTASKDLLGRVDVDGLGINYADSIEEDGGVPVLSVFDGEILEDDATSGVSAEAALGTEHRVTADNLLDTWKRVLSADFAEDIKRIDALPRTEQWDALEKEFQLSDYGQDVAKVLRAEAGQSSDALFQEEEKLLSHKVRQILTDAEVGRLRGVAAQSTSARDFAMRLSQAELTDLSNSDLHRWGRAIAPYQGEPYQDITQIQGNDDYMRTMRESAPATYDAVNGRSKTVRIYRAIPLSDPRTLLARYEREKAHILKTGKMPASAATKLNRSDYYDFLSSEVERLRALPAGETQERIRIGDYVALERRYAEEHGRSTIQGSQGLPYRIVSKTVPKRDVIWGETDWAEWAYSPKVLRDFAPSLEELYDKLGGEPLFQESPRLTFYRGTVPNSELRIEQPFEAAKGKVFVARTPESARHYGSQIEKYEAKPGAKVLYQESPEFWTLLGKRRPPNDHLASLKGGMIDNVNDAIRKAEAAGYDAVSFSQDSDVGTLILNELAFRRSPSPVPLFQEEERKKQTDTPEFKKWFGKSAAVDENGKPLAVYHGTGQGGFSEFGEQRTSYGYFFTPSREDAEFYTYGTKPQVYDVFLKIEKPLRLDLISQGERPVPSKLRDWIDDEFEGDRDAFLEWLGSGDMYARNVGRAQGSLFREAEGLDYDGIVFDDAKGGGGVSTSYVVFKPTQIKSASANRGTFDPDNPSILFQEAEPDQDLIDLGRTYVEEGVTKYEDWAAAIKDDLRGVGGRLPDEGTLRGIYNRVLTQAGPEQVKVTGIKNRVTKAEREAKGQDEIEVEVRRKFGDVFDRGKQIVDGQSSEDFRIWMRQIAAQPRALNAEESAGLIYDRMRLYNEHQAALDKIDGALKSSNERDLEQGRAQLARVEADIEANDEAARRVGYEQGLGLAARKMMIRRDYSLANLIQRAKAVTGKDVPPELRQKLTDLSKQLQDAEAKLSTAQTRIADLEKQAAFKREQQKVDPAKRRDKKSLNAEMDSLAEELGKLTGTSLFQEEPGVLFQEAPAPPPSPFSPDITRILTQMAKNRVEAGAKSHEQVVNEVYDRIKNALPGVDKDTLNAAISGYGVTDNLTKPEIERRLRELKRERALKGIKTRLNKTIADLERRLTEKDYVFEKRKPTEYDAEAEMLRVKRDGLKRQLDREIARQAPGYKIRTIGSLYKAGLLSGIKTHARNIGSNLAYQVFDEMARMPAVIGDWVVSAGTGRRTITGPSPSAALDSAIAAWKVGGPEAKEIFKHGMTAEQAAKQQFPEEVNTGVKVIDLAARTVFRAMAAEDRIFYNAAYRRNLLDRAKVQALNEVRAGTLQRGEVNQRTKDLADAPSPELKADADHDALVATFNNSNALSDAIRTGRAIVSSQLTKKVDPKAAAIADLAVDLVMPFDRTPTNILARLIGASPLAGVKLGYYAARTGARAAQTAFGQRKAAPEARLTARQIIQQAMTPAEQRNFAQTLGRSTVGTGIMALGYILAAKGLATGPPDDDLAKRERDKAVARTPMSIRFPNGDWHQVGRFSPLGNLLALGAGLYRETHDVDEKKPISSAVKMTGKAVIEEAPQVRGVESTTGLLTEPEKRGGAFAGRLVGSVIPQAVADVGALIDNTRRQPSRELTAQGIKEQVQERVPGLRSKLPVARDVFGRQLESRRTAFFDPTLTTTARERIDPVDKEVVRLDVPIAKVPKKDGETEEQYRERAQKVGEGMYTLSKRLVDNARYKTATDELKRGAFKQAVTKIRKADDPVKEGRKADVSPLVHNAGVRAAMLKTLSALMESQGYKSLRAEQKTRAKEWLQKQYTGVRAKDADEVSSAKTELRELRPSDLIRSAVTEARQPVEQQ